MSVKPDEVVILVLGVATLIMTWALRPRLRGFPRLGLFIAAYLVLLAGWVLTIFEDIFLRDQMNLLEHLCYAASTVLFALWCGYVFLGNRQEKK